MKHTSLMAASALLAALALSATPVAAQSRGHSNSRGGGSRGGGAAVGRAVPRSGPPPRVAGGAPYYRSSYRPSYRPYYRPYYGYGPAFGVGLYSGFGYGGFGFGYSGYPYGYYGYPYGYGYGNPYGYSNDGYGGYPAAPGGYVAAVPGRPYGSVRIQSQQRDAQVFADGNYVGTVNDFDGTFQHLNLEAGPHRIEIRSTDQNAAPIAFDVNVLPGQTITYRADIR